MMQQERYHGLDCVRAAAMLLGLLIHTCIFFMPPGQYTWWSGEYHGDPLNLAFLNFIHLFRMQLFFMMAGFFAQLVMEQKGVSHLFKDRVKRIVAPFVVGVLLVMPVHFFITNIHGFYTVYLDGMGPVDRFKSLLLWGIFAENSAIRYDWLIHYWFIYFLIAIYAIHFIVIRFGGNTSHVGTAASKILHYSVRNKYAVVLLGLIAFPVHYSLNSVSFPAAGYNASLNTFAYYVIFYFSGVVLYENRSLMTTLADNAWFYLLISVPFILYINEPTERIDLSVSVIRDINSWAILDFNLWPEAIFHNGWDKILVVFLRASLSWTLCFAFIGLAHRYLNTANPMVRYLADSAYWAYWIHLPITFGLAKFAQQIEFINSLTKCYVVLVISTVVIYVSYNTLVRYSWLGDYFMGKRKQKGTEEEANYALSVLCRKSSVPVIVMGAGVYMLGTLFQYNNQFEDNAVLIESYVARKEATLTAFDSLDGVTDKYGNTPLHTASLMSESSRRYNPLPVLLDRISNPDMQNCFGRTALFTAVRTGNKHDIELLIQAGADLDIVDRYGHSPAHVAAIKTGMKSDTRASHFFEILQLLIAKGANPELKDVKGRTVSDCLQQFGGRSFASR